MKSIKTTFNATKSMRALRHGEKASFSEIDSSKYVETPLRVGSNNPALADIVGMTPIDSLVGSIPTMEYHNTGLMTQFKNGEKIESHRIESLGSAKFDMSRSTGSGYFGVILDIDEDTREDSSIDTDEAMSIDHENRIINSENKTICEILLKDKTLGSVDPLSLCEKINSSLNAKAKKSTCIVTNNSGFAKLDVKDAFGNALISKTSDGTFIYDKKYEVIEIDNEIFPDLEEGAPIIIGDIASACTIVFAGSNSLDHDNITNFSKRFIDAECVVKLSNSDKCYIVGYMA